jgi:hypothetical protein
MYFVSLYTIPSQNRDAAQARFKQGVAPPPAGVKMIGRWHSVSGGRGVTICEADDAQAVAAWAQQWSDLITFDIYPALDDTAFAKLLG